MFVGAVASRLIETVSGPAEPPALEAEHEYVVAAWSVVMLLVDAARLDERVGRLRLVLKDAKLADIIEAIRGAAAGESLIAPRLAGSLLARLHRHDPRDESPAPVEPRLTEREREVLSLLVTGCDNIAIGKQLHLSPSTIKHHISSLLDKLGVENRIQAAVLAVRRGLLDEDERGAR